MTKTEKSYLLKFGGLGLALGVYLALAGYIPQVITNFIVGSKKSAGV